MIDDPMFFLKGRYSYVPMTACELIIQVSTERGGIHV